MTNSASLIQASQPIRRRELIDNAIRLIGRFGYRGFTVQALAVSSGLTNAGVLHHFGTKDGLLLAVLDEIERSERERMVYLVATTPDAGGDASRHLLAEMMQWAAARPVLSQFLAALQAESIDSAHPAHRWFAERDKETLALFTHLMGHHGERAASDARQLIALMQGLMLQWLRTGHAFDINVEWARSLDVILGPASGE